MNLAHQAPAGTDLLARPPSVAEARHVRRELGGGMSAAQLVLDDVCVVVPKGELVALTGPSGSGKSTLLYLLGVLDRPSAGQVLIDGIEVSSLDENERARLRNEKLGFVFQFHFLLPEFSVLENVTLPMMRRGQVSRSEADDRAFAVLKLLGLGELWRRRPGQLSGGQQQRTSIARAVANDPLLILADEPTGNLDSKNAAAVFAIFARLAREEHRTIVMVTHDAALADQCDRQIALKDGVIVRDDRSELGSALR